MTTKQFETIKDSILRTALAEVGFAGERDYQLLAIRLLGMSGYPPSKFAGFSASSSPTTVVTLNDPETLHNVYTTVGMIRRCQDQFYERIAKSIPRIFEFYPANLETANVKEIVLLLLQDMRFLLDTFKPMRQPPALQVIRCHPFTTEAVATAIKIALPPPPANDENPYEWINHRTIKMASVALFHGLLRWVNGRSLCPTELVDPEVRRGAIDPPPLHVHILEV